MGGLTRLDGGDAALLERCRQGDERAWEQVVARYGGLVRSIPLNHGLPPDLAADVAQSTFAELLSALHGIRDGQRLGAWLATVARRLTWRAMRAQRREIPTEIDLDAEAVRQGWLTSDIDSWSRRQWVSDALQTLEPDCRKLLLMLYFDLGEPTYDEIAERLDRPRGAIGPTRSRCLSKLLARLQQLDALT